MFFLSVRFRKNINHLELNPATGYLALLLFITERNWHCWSSFLCICNSAIRFSVSAGATIWKWLLPKCESNMKLNCKFNGVQSGIATEAA